MISDAQFIELDAEIWGLFDPRYREVDTPEREREDAADAALPVGVEIAPDAGDERRIERILEKARFEAVMKDSVGFLFKTMGTGASELGSAVIAAAAGEARSAGANQEGGADGAPSGEEQQHEGQDHD